MCASLGLFIVLIPFRNTVRRYAIGAYQVAKGKTVNDRLEELRRATRDRLQPLFAARDAEYPPPFVTTVGLKKVRVLEVWAGTKHDDQKLITTYPILGTSGKLGPKPLEGDHQVPEGLYEVESLNPGSMFYLSLRLNYPNEFDREMAKAEKREYPGSDIFVHGGTSSIGCLAMGDPAAEELFVMATDSGLEGVTVILSPVDFRKISDFSVPNEVPSWTQELYRSIETKLLGLGESEERIASDRIKKQGEKVTASTWYSAATLSQ